MISRPDRIATWARLAGAVLLFLLAIRMLGAAAASLQPKLATSVPALVTGRGPALAAGWLLTYLLMNGSVVAALAMALVGPPEVLAPDRAFLVLAGSRLGAAAFVVLVGFLEHGRRRARGALRRSLGLGFLTFLVTHSIYVPATLVGLPLLLSLRRGWTALLGSRPLPRPAPLELTGRVADLVASRLGGTVTVALGILLALVGIHLFGRALEGVDPERLRSRYERRLRTRWPSFLAGLFVTGATTSIAFSVGVLVPLFHRGLVREREAVPYLLGAGIGTLTDTAAVALVLGSTTALQVLLSLATVVAAITLLVLIVYARYLATMERALAWMLAKRRNLIWSAGLLIGIPLTLLLVP